VTQHVVVDELSRGRVFDNLDPAVVVALHALRFVRVTRQRDGRVHVGPRRKVGSVRIGDVQVTVRPKLSVRRLLFLLDFATDPHWRDEDVEGAEDEEVILAVVDAFARQLNHAFANGVPQEYRTVEEVGTVLRGRLRTSAQIGRQLGRLSPLEVEYDEYDADTPRNRLLATAVRRAIAVPGLRPATFADLRRAETMLDGVPSLLRRDPVPTVRADDPSSAYDAAVRLATVFLDDRSVELTTADGASALPVAAFTVDMWRVFEEFVTKALDGATAASGLVVRANRERRLDADGRITVRPDVLWLRGERPVAVADLKYKVETKSGHPNEDVYQILAYCLSLGLRAGHLVYAKGGGTSAVYRVGGLTVEAHAVDLTSQPSVLREQLQQLAARIAGGGATE
jgi:5-methylcytosine-specific restriction enzyme subunit McrC